MNLIIITLSNITTIMIITRMIMAIVTPMDITTTTIMIMIMIDKAAL